MLLSSESLLQLLQRSTKNSIKIKQIHSHLITNGDLLFIHNPPTFKWTTTILYNTLIRAYLNIHLPHTALFLFTHMISSSIPPNSHTFPSIAKAAAACYITPSIISKPLYVQALKRGVLADPFVRTSFVSLYAQTGFVSCARKVFDEMPEPCIVSCNALLHGFCKNGDMGAGVSFFERMPTRDVYSWTSVVNGYDRNGCYEAAIQVFRRMIMERCLGDCFVKPNEATFVSVLSSCANSAVGGLLNGKQIHGYVIKNEDQVTAFIGTALITLYGKTGGLEYATKVFKTMIKKEVCTWNAMIGALASNGKEKQAFEMFDKMNLGGWRPNEVTFVAILAACARAKLIDFGFEVFYSMMPRSGVVRRMEHYGCMVDLLGRAGFLVEAKDFLKKMPFEADATVLGALLGACKLHGDVELGDEVAKRLVELQPKKCGQYVLLSSIYAEAEKWDRASDLRNVMVRAGVEKPLGYSIVNAM
ncbi:hypothetical protein L6452_23351 [Arctium lappa]|uniref:Uncharacterized protein n=1 Tax=Arctium lappa TaxID=4217 RepID=A0ACB9B0Z6_ARCLA|nr:hypothetical protein L6452_23351 [Arctium lappa]